MAAVIDKEMFKSTLKVLALKVQSKYCSRFTKTFKPLLLNKKRMQSIVSTETDGEKLVLLSTDDKAFADKLEGPAKELYEEAKPAVLEHEISIGYDYYNVEEVLKKLLPESVEVPTSFETVGHIAHLNLRDEHLPYKELIGQVIVDKLSPRIRTVVNKTGTIQNEFRVFPMELLAGQPNYIAEVRQNGCMFKLDYSKVYWNTRLEQEHLRMVRSFSKDDVVCDMFGGIGPFAVPAGKRKVKVYANDLNPSSFEWLDENVKKNRVEKHVECFNMDGRDFVRELLKKCKDGPEPKPFFTKVVMNLPASAVEFLDVFRGAFDRQVWAGRQLPVVHCYAFSREEDPLKDLVERAAKAMGKPPQGATVFDVRDVSPQKRMYCLNFRLTDDIAFPDSDEKEEDSGEPAAKKAKTDE